MCQLHKKGNCKCFDVNQLLVVDVKESTCQVSNCHLAIQNDPHKMKTMMEIVASAFDGDFTILKKTFNVWQSKVKSWLVVG